MDAQELQARFRSQLEGLVEPITEWGGWVQLYLSMCSPEHPPPAELHGQDLDSLLVLPLAADEREPMPPQALRLEVGGLPHVLTMDAAIGVLTGWIGEQSWRVWDTHYRDLGGQLDWSAWVGGTGYPPHLLPPPKTKPVD